MALTTMSSPPMPTTMPKAAPAAPAAAAPSQATTTSSHHHQYPPHLFCSCFPADGGVIINSSKKEWLSACFNIYHFHLAGFSGLTSLNSFLTQKDASAERYCAFCTIPRPDQKQDNDADLNAELIFGPLLSSKNAFSWLALDPL